MIIGDLGNAALANLASLHLAPRQARRGRTKGLALDSLRCLG
jgi:hypothetical protein